MADINFVCISGRLTRDAELKQTTNGNQVLTFSIASNERRKNAAGEWEDYANYFDCSMFGERAQKLQKYLEKGNKVTVSGKLRHRSWEKEGIKHSRVEVIVNELVFMSRSGSGSQNNTGSGMQVAPQQAQPTYAAPPQQQQTGFYDDDIPF